MPFADCKDKSITIAFSEKEIDEYQKIKELTTAEIKDLLGIYTYDALNRMALKEERSINQVIKRQLKKKLTNAEGDMDMKKDVTFVSSKNMPFQRWYPYIEGYSTVFVKKLLETYNLDNGVIYDPFAGTGTTLFASDNSGLSSVYSEVNPLLQFIIDVKLRVLSSSKDLRMELAEKLIRHSKYFLFETERFEQDSHLEKSYTQTFSSSKYFPDDTFIKILKIRKHIDHIANDASLEADLITVAVLASLLPTSLLKKVGDVRFKTEKERKTELKILEDVLPNKLLQIAEDVSNVEYILKTTPRFLTANAKDIGSVASVGISAIITSPPYLNGTNYFRNTKVELWFLRRLISEGDLRKYRDQVLTSGINDVNKSNITSLDQNILEKSSLLTSTIQALNKTAYDKRIPVMAKSYFQEMYLFFSDVRHHLLDGATVLIDIGDSVFAGVHIQTDIILIDLLRTLGFTVIENKLLRKRRSKDQTILCQTLIALKWKA